MNAKEIIENLKCDGGFMMSEKEANQIISFIESQQQYAELGMAAVAGFNQDGNFNCNKVYKDWRCNHEFCGWQKFCRLRAGKGGE